MTFSHLRGRAEMLARELGLTPPAAEWVALAALHAGCFLRSQYCAYSEHSREAARLLVESLRQKRLAVEQPFEGRGVLCRLTSKAIYGALGAPEIRHHRMASRPILYRRLLSLDYVLDHPELPWLATKAEKLACFDALNIPRADLPSRNYDGIAGQTTHYFIPSQPLAVDTDTKTAVFVYVDGGEKTQQGLRSWRYQHEALWSRLYERGYRLSLVHAGRNRKRSKGVQNLFQHWRNTVASAAQIAALREEQRQLEEMLWENIDKSAIDEYDGFNKALRRSVKVKRVLDQKTQVIGYAASYGVWLSGRIRTVR